MNHAAFNPDVLSRQPIFVVGAGIICAIGSNKSEVGESIRSGISGLGRPLHIHSIHNDRLIVGNVLPDNQQLKATLGLPSEAVISRTNLLGLHAAKEAYDQAGWQPNDTFKTGLISATTVGGMDVIEDQFISIIEQQKSPNIHLIQQLDCGASTVFITKHLNIRNWATTISTACSSSANAIMFGARLIRHGIVDRVIVGGTESLSKFTLNGFLSLQILSDENCRPFDKDRAGLNLGEGSGFLALSSAAALNGQIPIGILSGYSNVNEAFHATASSPEGVGARNAMHNALVNSGLEPFEIGYINAHGTATEVNDLSEGLAIRSIFRDTPPVFSSTKAFTGHTLAAAGGIEAVISLLTLTDQFIPANLNFTTPMPETGLMPVTTGQKLETVRHIMSNSFGFGGNTSTLIFSKVSL